ncbi:MAG TPA: ATP-binding protein [Holophagaceae bacterium]
MFPSHGSPSLRPRAPLGRAVGAAVPWLVLAVGLAATAWAWSTISVQEVSYQQARLEGALAQTREGVEHAVEEQARLLRGAQGLASGRPRLAAEDWRAFVSSLDLGRYSPATRLMGYCPRACLEGTRGSSPLLEPEAAARDLGPGGGRLMADPEFQAAVARARDRGELAVSGRLQGFDPGASVIALVLPVFRDFSAPDDATARRATFQGAVVCVAEASQMFRPLFGASPIAGLDVEIYGDPGCGAGTLLYDRDLCVAQGGLPMAQRPGARRIPLRLGGRRWELVAGFVPEAKASRVDRPRLMALGGAAASLLAFAVTLVLSRSRRRSLALAHRLQESEARFRSLADTASCAIFTFSEVIEYMNATGAKMTGYPVAEILGQPLWKLVHPLDRDWIRGRAAARLRGEPIPSRYEFRLLTKDGATRWIDFTAGTVQAGERTLGLGTAFDVTDRVVATEARVGMERQLLEAQKLESLGLLAGGVAHDFNNLLTVIQGNAGILREIPDDPERAAACLRNIEDTCRRASDLVRQMLAYAGRGRLHVQATSLNEVVQEIAQLLAVSIPKSVELRFELAPGLPPIEADTAQMQQVVMNLVTNAAEAIGEALGIITLRSGEETLDDHAAAALQASETLKPGRFVYVEVQDTGSGMDGDTLARIFDPFFTTKFTGRGLGLAAMQGIVRGHGGAVRVHSAVGMGTTFRVYFPVREGMPDPASPAAPLPEGASWRGEGLVLVVDDEEGIRDFVQHTLDRAGFMVLQAGDGLAGLDAFREHREALRLVLLDLTMPRMGGEEALREMRTLRADIPAILWSGYGEREDPGAAATPFLRKPFNARELLDKVREALG